MSSDVRNFLNSIRRDYSQAPLEIRQHTSPLPLSVKWYEEAVNSQLIDANAMSIATVDSSLMPYSRIVLLRDVTEDGLVFYTNYLSNKGKHLASNPNISAHFFWPALERQIMVNGKVEKVIASTSDDYFNSRPYDSKIAAWASHQGSELDSRKTLETSFDKYKARFPEEVPRPENWGGYRIVPVRFEFWQGRAFRLHDRVIFELNEMSWRQKRLYP